MEGEAELLLHLLRQPVLVVVMQLDVERLEPAQRREADAARRDGADIHAFEVVGALDAIGDVPAASDHPAVGGDVVAHQRQDHHDDVLGDTDRVAVGHLGDGDALVHGGLKVGVVGADAGGDDELELLRLVEALLGHVGGPEGLRDHDLGVRQLLLEGRIRTVLVGGHDQRVAGLFQELAQAQLAGDAAEQFARLEVDLARRRRGHAVRDSGRSWGCRRGHISGDSRRPDRHREQQELLPWVHSFIWGDPAHDIDRLASTRGEQRPAAMSLSNWIKAWRGTRIPPRPHVSSCRPAQVVRASGDCRRSEASPQASSKIK